MENLSIQTLKEHHLDDCARLITKNMIFSNPVWKNYNLSFDELQTIMRAKLVKAL